MMPPQAGPGPKPGPAPGNRDERLGEAVEAFLELAESGRAPELESFLSGYPDLADELREALDGLALVQGLVGSGVGPGGLGTRRLEAGYRVAGYRIVRELGRGGMGVVYEAVHVDLDRPVALKILGGHAAPGSSGRRRFLNEAKTAAGLHHTHIVPVFDVGQVGGLCYYAMQRIEGSGLDRVLRVLRRDRLTASGSPSGRGSSGPSPHQTAALDDDHHSASHSASGLLSVPGRGGDSTASWAPGARAPIGAPRRDDRPPPFLPPTGADYYRWVARVGRQAAEALAYAHRRGVVHRDVKPSNLLVDARGIVWVADFGLARRLEDPGQTRGDGPVGTPRYMSPEQAEGRTVGPATDVYSLGATLYELLTLRPPFDGQSTAELVRQIADRDPPPPRKFARRLPRDLETIVLKAMSKRPGDRYASAAELAEDLGRFLDFEPVLARRISPVGRTWRLARRHPAASIISSAAAVAILATAAFAYVRIANERDRVAVALEKQRDATRAEQAARAELADALEVSRAATRAEQAARAGELLSQLPVLRDSTTPRRREAGRAKLAEAARLAPDESMRLLLRDEAVALLADRDVEDRPALATGRVRGLVPVDPDPGPDGPPGLIAVLGEDGDALSIWDVEKGLSPATHHLRPLDPTEGGEGPGESSRRGGWTPPWPGAALVGRSVAVSDPDGAGVLLVDPASGSSSPLPLDGAEVLGLLATPDGRRLVTVEATRRPPPDHPAGEEVGDGDGDGDRRGPRSGFRVRLWDLDTIPAAPLETLDAIEAEPGQRFGEVRPLVAIDPEGRTVLVARSSPESRVVIYDVEDGGRLSGFTAGMGLTALAAGPDGLVATAGDGRILLWEVDAWAGDDPIQLPGLSEPRGGYIRQLNFSPSGRLLAAVGMNTGVELWDPAANSPVAVVSTEGWVQDVAFADDRTLLVASGPSTEVWSIAEPIGRVAFEFPADAPTRLPAFGPDGLLVMPLLDDAPRVWHPDHCPTRARPWDRPEVHSAAFALGPDGLLLAFGPDGLSRFDSPDEVPPVDRLPWPPPDAGPEGGPAPEFEGIRVLARSPDRRAVLVLRDFDWPDDEPGRDREPPGPGRRPRRDPYQLWLWHADERGGPGSLARIEPPRGAEIRLLPPMDDPSGLPPEGSGLVVVAPVGGPIRVRAFDDEGRMVLDDDARSLPGRASAFEELEGLLSRREGDRPPSRRTEDRIEDALRGLVDGVRIGRFPRPDAPPPPFVPAAALSPDGRLLFFLERGELHGWDLDGGRPEPLDLPPIGRSGSLAMHPDGSVLALGGEGGEVSIVSTETFDVLARLSPPEPARPRWASAVAFSPDGSSIAVGDYDGSLSLWWLADLETPRRQFLLPGRRNAVFGLAFSPDGRRLACIDGRGAEERVVEAWDLLALREELSSLGLGW